LPYRRVGLPVWPIGRRELVGIQRSDCNVTHHFSVSCQCLLGELADRLLSLLTQVCRPCTGVGKYQGKGFEMRFPWLLCATVGLLTLGVTAFAQDTIINYSAGNGVFGADITYTDSTGTHTNTNTYVGPITAETIDPVTHQPVTFTVYCVDLENLAVSPTSALVNTIDPSSVNGAANYDLSTSTYTSVVPGTYSDLIKASWLIDTYDPNSTLSGDAGIALQVAIWDVVDEAYNPTLGVSTSKFGYSGPDATNIDALASGYITALEGVTDFSGVQGVYYQVDRPNMSPNSSGQDMLGGGGGTGSHPFPPSTPEGASLLMFLPGLIPVAVGLRRRRNKAAGK